MDWMKTVVRAALPGLILSLAAAAGHAAIVPATFDPLCLPWSGARYQAQKLFITAELDVTARLLDEPPLAALWPVEGRAPLMPREQTLSLSVATRGPGRRTLEGELLLDASSGGILQYASLREPSARYRVYRFTASGPQRRTAKPLAHEVQAAPSSWSDVDIRQRTYAVGALTEPVLEVSTLLYLLAASPLAAPGDVLRVNGYATSADELYEVTATAGERSRLAVDYRAIRAGEAQPRRSVIPVLPIRVEGRPQSADGSTAGFDILGLHDVEFLLDPDRRVIVALRARIPALGGVQFQLRSLDLTATDPPRRCRAAAG